LPGQRHKKTLLDTILSPQHTNRWNYLYECNAHDEFADKLKNDYPEKIVEHHWKKVYN
jgi:hypothetical protein